MRRVHKTRIISVKICSICYLSVFLGMMRACSSYYSSSSSSSSRWLCNVKCVVCFCAREFKYVYKYAHIAFGFNVNRWQAAHFIAISLRVLCFVCSFFSFIIDSACSFCRCGCCRGDSFFFILHSVGSSIIFSLFLAILQPKRILVSYLCFSSKFTCFISLGPNFH